MSIHGSGEYVQTEAGRVYVELEGTGPVVVLVPGGPGTGHAHYHPWFSRLAQRNRVVYFDQLGTGRSERLADPDAYTIQLYAATLEELRRHLEADDLALIGLSFGGLPAIRYTLDHAVNVRCLVLSNAQLSAATWQETNIDNVNHELRNQFPELWEQLLALRQLDVGSLDDRYQQLFERIEPGLNWFDPINHPRLAHDAEEQFSMGVYRAIIGDDPEWEVSGTLAGYDPSAELAELRTPTLVVSGRWDRITPPRIAHKIKQALPPSTSELLIFERSAHRPWAEEAEQYFSAVEVFLG